MKGNMSLGETQIAILKTARNQWFNATTRCHQRACLRMHERGLLSRDPKAAHLYITTRAGNAFLDTLAAETEH